MFLWLAATWMAQAGEALLSATSRNAEDLQLQKKERLAARLQHMEKEEAYRAKLEDCHELQVKAFVCMECRYTREAALQSCRDAGHAPMKVKVAKKWWSCRKCRQRTTTLGGGRPKASQVCRKCGAFDWVKAGMVASKKAVSPSEQLNLRGGPEIKSLRYR